MNSEVRWRKHSQAGTLIQNTKNQSRLIILRFLSITSVKGLNVCVESFTKTWGRWKFTLVRFMSTSIMKKDHFWILWSTRHKMTPITLLINLWVSILVDAGTLILVRQLWIFILETNTKESSLQALITIDAIMRSRNKIKDKKIRILAERMRQILFRRMIRKNNIRKISLLPSHR